MKLKDAPDSSPCRSPSQQAGKEEQMLFSEGLSYEELLGLGRLLLVGAVSVGSSLQAVIGMLEKAAVDIFCAQSTFTLRPGEKTVFPFGAEALVLDMSRTLSVITRSLGRHWLPTSNPWKPLVFMAPLSVSAVDLTLSHLGGPTASI